MRVSKGLRLCMALFGCLFGHFAAGEEAFYMALERGEFQVDHDDYQQETDATSLLAGFIENQYTLQLNAYEFDDIRPGEDETAYRRVEGYSLQLGKEFRLTNKLNVELAYGRFWWEVRDFEDNALTEKQSDAGRLLEAQLSMNFGQVRLYFSRKEMRKVAGSDIDVMMFGVRYSFR